MSEFDPTELVLRVNRRDGRFHGDFEDFDPERFRDLDLGIYQTGTYRDGQREGSYEYFYSSGVLRSHGTYENGELHGPYESYYENGEPRNKINYTDGELDGPFESYDENGQLVLKGTYSADRDRGHYYLGHLYYIVPGYLGQKCGEWFENGETVTYDPCPPGLEDGN